MLKYFLTTLSNGISDLSSLFYHIIQYIPSTGELAIGHDLHVVITQINEHRVPTFF